LASGHLSFAEEEEMGDSENCHPSREWLLLSGFLKMTQKGTWFVTRPYEGNFMACWLLSGFWRLENARNREHDLFRNTTAYMRCPAGFFLASGHSKMTQKGIWFVPKSHSREHMACWPLPPAFSTSEIVGERKDGLFRNQ
jgi:hypothetical protein